MGYRETSSPGRYPCRGKCSLFRASIEAEGAKLAMPLVASELSAVLREGSARRAPAHSGSFTLTKKEGE